MRPWRRDCRLWLAKRRVCLVPWPRCALSERLALGGVWEALLLALSKGGFLSIYQVTPGGWLEAREPLDARGLLESPERLILEREPPYLHTSSPRIAPLPHTLPHCGL
jgi:hypothetical protein